jgi:hypothetical protein
MRQQAKLAWQSLATLASPITTAPITPIDLFDFVYGVQGWSFWVSMFRSERTRQHPKYFLAMRYCYWRTVSLNLAMPA